MPSIFRIYQDEQASVGVLVATTTREAAYNGEVEEAGEVAGSRLWLVSAVILKEDSE